MKDIKFWSLFGIATATMIVWMVILWAVVIIGSILRGVLWMIEKIVDFVTDGVVWFSEKGFTAYAGLLTDLAKESDMEDFHVEYKRYES